MNRWFPRAEDLDQDEIDYELDIRSQPREVFELDLQGKQRHLRQLIKNDIKEGRNYRTNFKIQNEAGFICRKIEHLENVLKNKVEPKHESRIIHYYYRVQRCVASSQEEKKLKGDLCHRIERIMQEYQFGPSLSPYKEQINSVIQDLRGAVGTLKHSKPGQTSLPDVHFNEQWAFPVDRSKGAISKSTRLDVPGTNREHTTESQNQKDTIVVSRTEWEEMKRMLSELLRAREHVEDHGKVGNQEQDRRGMTDRSSNRGAKTDQQPMNSFGGRSHSASDDEVPAGPAHRGNGSRRGQGDEDRDSYEESIYSYDSNRFRPHRQDHQRHRCHAGQGRVEKWKLRFSGDPRGISVENFLYKATKLAEREGVSKQALLRDIHMLLEGAASDWFFTYVDGLVTWEDFQNGITYRFGNPNKDQGIRSKIQERKQQRGESFIAFVSEIEKLNRMLSQPLSERRKFEVIWDNMRQHYRSKISIVKIRDLNHLIDLNYRIDAADHHLQQQTNETPFRRPVNQIEAEDDSSYDEEERATDVNMIRRETRNRPLPNRSSNEVGQQTTSSRQREDSEGVNARWACWNCQEVGHGWRQCTKSRNVFCYGCGFLGRTIRSCERCSRVSSSQSNVQQGN